jgi:hypothetical protein
MQETFIMTNKKLSLQAKPIVDARRGTALWALNQLRSDALPRLMEDLLIQEPVGLQPDQCNKVENALRRVWIHAGDIPDKIPFLPVSIQNDMEQFLKAYVNWNDPKGTESHSIQKRKKALREMIKRRHAMATRLRKRQHILSNNLDLKVVDGMYEGLSDLPKSLPDIFRNLSKAINNYEKKKKKKND